MSNQPKEPQKRYFRVTADVVKPHHCDCLYCTRTDENTMRRSEVFFTESKQSAIEMLQKWYKNFDLDNVTTEHIAVHGEAAELAMSEIPSA